MEKETFSILADRAIKDVTTKDMCALVKSIILLGEVMRDINDRLEEIVKITENIYGE